MNPEPVRTKLAKIWRWDYFTNEADAEAWEAKRLKEGVGGVKLWAPRKRYNETEWYVVSRQGVRRIQSDRADAWPKIKIDHCRHCHERLTYDRIENPKWLKPSPLRRRFTYAEREPRHTCPGLVQERDELALTAQRLNEILFSALRRRGGV